MRNVKILRGIPGAGKSTTAMNLYAEYGVKGTWVQTFSADYYFTREGVYSFDAKKLGAAHNECLRGYVKAVTADLAGEELIVVDNTSTTISGLLPYVKVAQAFGVPFEVITVACPPEIAAARCIHNVPAATVWRMHRQLVEARIPKDWPHRTVVEEIR